MPYNNQGIYTSLTLYNVLITIVTFHVACATKIHFQASLTDQQLACSDLVKVRLRFT